MQAKSTQIAIHCPFSLLIMIADLCPEWMDCCHIRCRCLALRHNYQRHLCPMYNVIFQYDGFYGRFCICSLYLNRAHTFYFIVLSFDFTVAYNFCWFAFFLGSFLIPAVNICNTTAFLVTYDHHQVASWATFCNDICYKM